MGLPPSAAAIRSRRAFRTSARPTQTSPGVVVADRRLLEGRAQLEVRRERFELAVERLDAPPQQTVQSAGPGVEDGLGRQRGAEQPRACGFGKRGIAAVREHAELGLEYVRETPRRVARAFR